MDWMEAVAARHDVHLAGSLYIQDDKEIYDSQIIMSPSGQHWRYDKNYPWLFERAYFQAGNEIMIADTEIGKLGMMICWDYAHPELWQRYAGKIDALIVTSSPPNMERFKLLMPNGNKVDARALGPLINRARYAGDQPFGEDLNAQADWLGVPLVNSGGTGQFRSHLPGARAMYIPFTMFRPDLWGQVSQAHEVEMVTDFYSVAKVVSADGKVLAQAEEKTGDSFALATVGLPDKTPVASEEEQPDIPYTAFTYFMLDVLGPSQMESHYRRGVRQQWGEAMAPFQRTYRWHIILGLGIVGLVATLLRFVGGIFGGQQTRPEQ